MIKGVLEWLASIGRQVIHDTGIAPDSPDATRKAFGQVVLDRRVGDPLAASNSGLTADALDYACRKLANPDCRLRPGLPFSGLILPQLSISRTAHTFAFNGPLLATDLWEISV